MELSVVLPSYKEEENLKILLPKIKKALESIQSEILVVDTMEKMDNTKLVCEGNDVRYINRKGGNYYGDAIRTGINEAKGKYMVFMDADGSHNPKDIRRLLTTIISTSSDVVIGSRYIAGGHTDNNFMLRLMSHMVNITYRLVFNLKVKDVSNSFRIYKSDQMKSITLVSNNFDIVEEILISLNINYPLKITEIPIVFNKRLHGESKRDLVKFAFSYLKTIKDLWFIQNKEKAIRKKETKHGTTQTRNFR